MTLLGLDTSNVNGRLFDAHLARSQGASFSYHKVSEGTYFTDRMWPGNRDAALNAGMSFVCGYHFLTAYPDGATQADFFMARLGDPDKHVGIVVDVETAGNGTGPSYSTVAQFVDRIARRYGRVTAIYTGGWYWKGHLGNPNGAALGPLVDAAYLPGNPAGSLQGLAAQVTPSYFQPYGGWDIGHRLWRQFGSNGNAGGISPVDCNWTDRADIPHILGLGAAPCPPNPEKLSLQVAQLPTLGPGASGPAVATLQSGLNVGQAARLTVDGGYGPATTAAVESAQRLWKQTVDGIAGPVTRRYVAYEIALKGQ